MGCNSVLQLYALLFQIALVVSILQLSTVRGAKIVAMEWYEPANFCIRLHYKIHCAMSTGIQRLHNDVKINDEVKFSYKKLC